MTLPLIRAIEILLRKCLPDLTAAEIETEQTHRYVIEIPALSMSSAEWEAEATRAAREHPRLVPHNGV